MSSALNTEQRRKQYLRSMGIDLYKARTHDFQLAPASLPDVQEQVPVQPESAELPSVAPQAVVSQVSDMDWGRLTNTVVSCSACVLAESRTQTVFGVGNPQADWMIIGEAPGVDEDRQGEPFVGKAGQLLTLMLKAAGFERQDVYIANILKCRPPDNRDPRPEEVTQCIGYLERQIALVQPKVILAVGRIAAHNLLQVETPVGRLRGTIHRYGPQEIPLLVTYHPAYLLRSPREKRKSWQDLCRALRLTAPADLPLK